MAHELAVTAGRHAMAYVGQKPWHGLGQELTPGASIETWIEEAGMNWDLESVPVMYYDPKSRQHAFRKNQQILLRSDTREDLSQVSTSYKIVQPKEVLEFYRDLTEAAGFELETAGVLFNGQKYWALAKMPAELTLPGEDKIGAYLLLATSCDASMATTAQFTTVRVVCNNTLQMSLSKRSRGVRVPHNRNFDADQVKKDLGLWQEQWDAFSNFADSAAQKKLSNSQAVEWLVKVYGDINLSIVEQTDATARKVQSIFGLWNGDGMGSGLESSQGTLWGLLNAVTEDTDHSGGYRSTDSRLDNSWFGSGRGVKERAVEAAQKLLTGEEFFQQVLNQPRVSELERLLAK